MKTEYQYRAFISYSHKDKKQVAKLQKKLEALRLPKAFRSRAGVSEKRIFPVFRDDSDLVGVDLMDSIRKALSLSEYLIVICSLNSASSYYVNKEVAYFVENGRSDYIIPVIIQCRSHKGTQMIMSFPFKLLEAGIKINDAILYTRGTKREAVFRIAYRILGLTDSVFFQKYVDRRRIKAIFASLIVFPVISILLLVIGVYTAREIRIIHSYCEEIAFEGGLLPIEVRELDGNGILPDNYYTIERRLSTNQYLCRVKHFGTAYEKLPFSMRLLEAECMEYDFNQYYGENGYASSRVSKVCYFDNKGQVLFVKNYSLNLEIVDLTVSKDSSNPYYLPFDMTSDESGGEKGFSCRIAQLYDEEGRLETVWYLSDSASNIMVCDKNGFYGHRYERTSDGIVQAVVYLDIDGKELSTLTLRNDNV